MYAEFLEAVLAYVQALNKAADSIDEQPGMTPYVNHIPVIVDDATVGFLVDEIGGRYSYREATDADHEWWDARPWRQA